MGEISQMVDRYGLHTYVSRRDYARKFKNCRSKLQFGMEVANGFYLIEKNEFKLEKFSSGWSDPMG